MNGCFGPIKNKNLFSLKISELSNNIFLKENSFSFNFHSIPIKFYSNSLGYLELIQQYIPKDWKNEELGVFNQIYHSPPSKDIELAFDDETSSIVFEKIIDNSTTVTIQRDFVAEYNQVSNSVKAIFHPELNDGFHNFFRWYLSPKLIPLEKAMLHCSVILKKDGRANIFLGPSGAGKTTITSLAGERITLSDDMNLVAIENGKLAVYPGGVGGLYKPQVAINNSFKVANIFWLKQSSKNGIQALSPITQQKFLLASLANLNWRGFSASNQDLIFDLIDKVLRLHKITELEFRKDSSIWQYLDS